MNKGGFEDSGEQMVEQGQMAGKPVKREEDKKKVDPVTGKPIPSKKILTQLNKQVAQLAQMRLKKVREELEKQRLKVNPPPNAKASEGQAVPKPKEDIVAKTLKGSKSTGEFKGLIGG